jgi:hypothetical protein
MALELAVKVISRTTQLQVKMCLIHAAIVDAATSSSLKQRCSYHVRKRDSSTTLQVMSLNRGGKG